jgi:serpin B
MQAIRAGGRTIHDRSGLPLLALLLIVSPSCGPASDSRDRPTATPGEGPGRSRPIDKAAMAQVQAVVDGNNQFAFDLYARLRTGRSDNLFLSPASLSTAMAMTYAGARGQTAEEMARVLHFGLPQEKLHPAFALLRATWVGDGEKAGYRLNVANRLWGQEGFEFLPGFLSVTREDHGAELAPVDFARQAEQGRRRINAWVEEQTQGKIRDLIPTGVLDVATRLVLTSAIAFKGEWTVPF